MRLIPLLFLAATMATAPVLVHAQDQNESASRPLSEIFDRLEEEALRKATKYQEGVDASEAGEHKVALEIFQSLARNGYAEAQHQLGQIYYNGNGVEQSYGKAFYWYQTAAKQGHSTAQLRLAEMYEISRGLFMKRLPESENIPKDDRMAAKWYRKSAEQGNAIAQGNLAGMYFDGRGLDRNFSKAAKWCKKAAIQGNHAAQLSLGTMYREGIGVPQNFINAYILYNLGAINQSIEIRNVRDQIAEKLTPDQLAEAQRLSLKWEVGEPLPLQGG